MKKKPDWPDSYLDKEKIRMKKTTDNTKKTPPPTAEEIQALVAALKKSGTKAGTGDQISAVRRGV
jgi:hypothetical protein